MAILADYHSLDSHNINKNKSSREDNINAIATRTFAKFNLVPRASSAFKMAGVETPGQGGNEFPDGVSDPLHIIIHVIILRII